MTKNMETSARQFRALLARPGIIQSMGVHDVFTALIAQEQGLETIFLGGFGVSASLLGLPDLNFLSAPEMADMIRRTTPRLRIPVIADGDTGHGDLHNVRRTVELFEAAGAAGILIEDQVMPKRCGHFARKQVVTPEEMAGRIRTAVAARHNPDFLVFARTDARQMNGLDDAIERIQRCADVGADVAFVEAPQSLEELAAIPQRVRLPAFANMVSGGVTPVVSTRELEQMGYKIAVCPVESLMVCARAMRELCATWKKEGRVDHLAGAAMSFTELKSFLGVERELAVSNRP